MRFFFSSKTMDSFYVDFSVVESKFFKKFSSCIDMKLNFICSDYWIFSWAALNTCPKKIRSAIRSTCSNSGDDSELIWILITAPFFAKAYIKRNNVAEKITHQKQTEKGWNFQRPIIKLIKVIACTFFLYNIHCFMHETSFCCVLCYCQKQKRKKCNFNIWFHLM